MNDFEAKIEAYQKIRNTVDKTLLCHAPFSSINFEQNGNMTACCFNRMNVLGTYPHQSIAAAWKGAEAEFLRSKIKEQKLDGGCKLCGILLDSGNYSGTKAIHYDEYAHNPLKNKLRDVLGMQPQFFPKVFEFEISNTCNLACTMCSGYFSSTIREKREKLPALPNPYDDDFVDQVADFLPGLTDMKFLGGEPFMVELYLKIWENVIKHKPSVRIHITTNGTVLNSRIKDLLKKLKAGIILSIDSINKENFEAIRVGAKFEKVIDNLDYFSEYTKKQRTYLSISSCVMTSNWRDIPDLIHFANKRDIYIHFNVVWNPGHLSLRYLHFSDLKEIVAYYDNQFFESKTSVQKENLKNFNEMKGTIALWQKERNFTTVLQERKAKDFESISLVHSLDNTFEKEIFSACLLHYLYTCNSSLLDKVPEVIKNFSPLENPAKIKVLLNRIYKEKGEIGFVNYYYPVLNLFYRFFYGTDKIEDFSEKTKEFKSFILNNKNLQALVSDIIDDIEKYSIVNQLDFMKEKKLDEMKRLIVELY